MPKVIITNEKGLVQQPGSGFDVRSEVVIRKRKVQNINEATNLTSADFGYIILGGAIGATQGTSEGFTVKLPAPVAGGYFKFILRPAALHNSNGAQIHLHFTSDGSTNANKGVGQLLVNGSPTNKVAVQGKLTFVKAAATCGDQVECWSDGTVWYFLAIADASGAITAATH